MLGTIETGKVANLVVVEGNLFDKEGKVRDTWINGRRHEISRAPEFVVKGDFAFFTNRGVFRSADVDTEKSSITVNLDDDESVKATKVTVQKEKVSFLLDGKAFDTEGLVQLSGIITGDGISGTGIMPDGDRFEFNLEPAEETDVADADEEEADDEAAGDAIAKADDEDDDATDDFTMPADQLVFPLGAYGVTEAPAKQDVYIHNATVWTSGPQGIIENACLIVRDGVIPHVGAEPAGGPDADLLVIDAQGRHVTPGLLDCHSHAGISGGVNEGSEAVTSEVRIGDVINPDDINFYRQLAGGLTTINQLHGSANPIDGQNSVVKLKWGSSMADMKIHDAIAGIKFALGENPKRAAGRYPDTRMGVATVIEDSFTAAKDYQAVWNDYLALSAEERERTMPPRRDLELDALVEIIEGERLVHCHSYRQDEILMLIRVADKFGFTIGTFQHVLEGYKIADAIAAHGAGASTFSDWWAYKVEVMDAVPYNGALMTEVGVLVSFNSDSSELARRMNTEASKAVRYGGMDPAEALKLVTINPAKQLRIDHRLGSLEVGKDGDFAIWSESPLSTYARCEQTWIEGARYFDLRIDEMLRKQTGVERQRLIQKILAKSGSDSGGAGDGPRRGRRGGRGGPRPSNEASTEHQNLEIRTGQGGAP
jgi:imidazolonepropionase-like amidohydrolase